MAFAAYKLPVTGYFIHKETARPFEFVNSLDVFQVIENGKVHSFPQQVYVGPQGTETSRSSVFARSSFSLTPGAPGGCTVPEQWVP